LLQQICLPLTHIHHRIPGAHNNSGVGSGGLGNKGAKNDASGDHHSRPGAAGANYLALPRGARCRSDRRMGRGKYDRIQSRHLHHERHSSNCHTLSADFWVGRGGPKGASPCFKISARKSTNATATPNRPGKKRKLPAILSREMIFSILNGAGCLSHAATSFQSSFYTQVRLPPLEPVMGGSSSGGGSRPAADVHTKGFL